MRKSVPNKLHVVDLFCGAGGFSSGFIRAADAKGLSYELVAVNHWDVAIRTHTENHPHVRHYCQSVGSLVPREVLPGRKLHLMLASPECTHHSTALGGRPMSEQRRATPWDIMEWVEQLQPDTVLLENVKEFSGWGPLYPCRCGAEEAALKANPDITDAELLKVKHAKEAQCHRPIPKHKGRYFRNFVRNLRTFGYRVEWKVLNSADYGACTSRPRMFLQARLGRSPIVWPAPTHARHPEKEQTTFDFASARRKWRGCREII